MKHWSTFYRGFCLTLFLACVPAGASAQTLAAGECYARTYDAAHLKAHPRQKVRAIILRKLQTGSAGVLAPGKVALLVGFRFRNTSEHFQNYAECRQVQRDLRCDFEGDAGSFRLKRLKGNNLRLQVTRTLGVEGSTMIEFAGKYSDDNLFLLRKAPAPACARLKAP